MRILKLTLDTKEQRSNTVSILKGENLLRIQPFLLSVKDLVMVLQDSDGIKRRILFSDALKQTLNENVTRFSSFWFESGPLSDQFEIEVELK